MPTIEPQFIIPFAKPSGVTSFTSLWQVKRALGTKKVGHTGTLDSFADGLLVLLSGKLTKLVPYITDFDKTYRVLFYFGKETDTLDPEGTVIVEKPLPTYPDFIVAIQQLTGTIEQVPPVYSAVKQAGERLSDKIRRGEAVTAPPRTITIYSIDIEEVFYAPEADTAGSSFPKNWLETGVKKSETDVAAVRTAQNVFGAEKSTASAAVRMAQTVQGAILCVCCSKGTYIRSLVRDIAHRCDSAAYVYARKRRGVRCRYGFNDCAFRLCRFKRCEERRGGCKEQSGFGAPTDYRKHDCYRYRRRDKTGGFAVKRRNCPRYAFSDSGASRKILSCVYEREAPQRTLVYGCAAVVGRRNHCSVLQRMLCRVDYKKR